MNGNVIGELRRSRAHPRILLRGYIESIHPDDRTRRIGAADRGMDVAQPEFRLGGIFHRPEAVGLVTRFPCDDRGMMFHAAHKIIDETPFPFQGNGILIQVESLQRARKKQTRGHVSGKETDDELDAVFLRDVAELLEALHHRFIDSGVSGGGIGTELLRFKHAGFVWNIGRAAGLVNLIDRLEVVPCGENAEKIHSVFRENLHILFDCFGTPFAPHLRCGAALPVVDAERHCSVFKHVFFSFSDRMQRLCRERGSRNQQRCSDCCNR